MISNNIVKLGYPDLIILIAFLLGCLGIGLYKSSKIKNLRDFALSNDISLIMLICTIFASTVGAGSTIGVVEKVYHKGIVFVINQILEPFAWLVSLYITAYGISRFKGCITFAEIMYKLYHVPGRLVTVISSVIKSIGMIAAQAIALGGVLNYFLGISADYGVLLSYTIIAIYAAFGGIKAVVHNEVFKFVVFFTIIPTAYIIYSIYVSNPINIAQSLPKSHVDIELSLENIMLIVGFLPYMLLPGFYPAFIQRALIAKNPQQFKSALYVIATLSVALSGILCLIAYHMRAQYPNLESNVLFSFINLLPDYIKGLMISGLVAVVMSISEAEVNATSVIIVNDAINVIWPKLSNKKQLSLLRIITVLITLSPLLIIKLHKDILELVWLINNFWGPLITIPATAGFLGFKTNGKSFIVSVIVALIATFAGRCFTGAFSLTSWCFGILGSSIGLFGMHYYQVISSGDIVNIPWLQYTLRLLKLIFIKPLIVLKQVGAQNLSLITTNPGVHKLKIRGFCTYTFIYYFFYIFTTTATHEHKIFGTVIIIGYLLCILLLFRDFILPKRFIENYLHYYWYFLLTFCLPFVSSYMLFASHAHDLWDVNGLLTAFALYLFVDSRRFVLLYTIGMLGGYMLYVSTSEKLSPIQDFSIASNVAYIYLSFLFIMLFFFRKREDEQEERVETMHMFGGAMAHEVKSPLATMSMCTDTIEDILSNASLSKKKDCMEINIEDFAMLKEFSGMLSKTSTQGINTVDSLLTALRNNVIADDKGIYTIEECITQAMAEYEMSNQFKDGVIINIVNDFSFYGSMHYIKHVLFNLLSNTYKYAGRGVKIELTAKANKLHFKDYGKGIAEEELPYIFDRFYTKSKSGTGIGLAFCKMIMEDLGGGITCRSKLGKYTEFVLYFPKA